MAVDFKKFNRSVDLDQLRKDIAKASENDTGDFPTVPAGKYEVAPVTLELGLTKKDERPMLKASFKILSGEYENQRLFMNRVIYGTKDDARMIKSAVGWLNTLESGLDVAFEDYDQFKELVMDVHEAIDGKLEYAVDYDDGKFNSITITEVFDAEN